MVKFLFGGESIVNHRIEVSLKRIVNYCQVSGPLKKSSEEAHELINELNKNFSPVRSFVFNYNLFLSVHRACH